MEESTAGPTKSRWVPWIIGCGIGFLLLSCLCAGGLWYGFLRFERFAADKVREMLVMTIHGAGIDAAEAEEMVGHVDRLRAAYEDDQVDLTEITPFFDEEPQRFLYIAQAQALARRVRACAELTPEEKDGAERSLQRFQRGLYEDRIPQWTARDVLAELFPIQIGESPFKLTVDGKAVGDIERYESPPRPATDPDEPEATRLRRTLERVRVEVDLAKIEDEAWTIDVGEAFGRLVDETIAR